MLNIIKTALQIRKLRSKEHYERLRAAEQLGDMGHRQALAPLIAALRDGSNLIARAAATSLGKLEDKRAIGALVNSLPRTGQEGANALMVLEWQPTNENERAKYAVAQGLFPEAAECGAVAIEPLLFELCNESCDHPQRNPAALALNKIGVSAVEPLLAVLGDKARYCQARAAAARVLGLIGDRRALDALILALNDAYSPTAVAAAESLGNFIEPTVSDALVCILSRRYQDHELRSTVGASLRRFPNVEALVDQYLRVLTDRSPETSPECEVAAYALGSLHSERAVETLVAAASWPEAESVRRAAIHALGELGDKRATDILAVALRTERVYMRWEAADALGKLKDPRAMPPLVACLLQERDDTVRATAACALREIGVPDAEAVKALCQAVLTDRDWEVRKLAAAALGVIGRGDEVIAVLERATKDENEYVTFNARKSLARLGHKGDAA